MAVQNGRIPTSQMRQVDGWAWLAPGAAAAWLLFAFAVYLDTGIRPTITKPDGAFRSYARQVWWWLNRKIKRVVVAPPGTSNHGLGMAIDIANYSRFNHAYLVAKAANYGFLFDTRSENWHIRYLRAPNYYPAAGSAGGTATHTDTSLLRRRKAGTMYVKQQGTIAPIFEVWPTTDPTSQWKQQMRLVPVNTAAVVLAGGLPIDADPKTLANMKLESGFKG